MDRAGGNGGEERPDDHETDARAKGGKIGFSAGFGVPRVRDLIAYRKVAIAVVSSYLGLDDGFVDAVLVDQMDEWLQAEAPSREELKSEHYDEYVALLSREIIVRYAATAAETLLANPAIDFARNRIMGDSGAGMGLTDDVNAVVRVHEIYEYLESPDAGDEAERIFLHVKRQMCNYYNACAFDLVKGQLLPVIVGAAEELYRSGSLSAPRVRDLIIAGQNARPRPA